MTPRDPSAGTAGGPQNGAVAGKAAGMVPAPVTAPLTAIGADQFHPTGPAPQPYCPDALGDILTPDQHLQPHPLTGEQKLALAVLEHALRTLLRGRWHTEWREIRQWIRSDTEAWPFAFVPVCQILNLEPAYVRTRALQLGVSVFEP